MCIGNLESSFPVKTSAQGSGVECVPKRTELQCHLGHLETVATLGTCCLASFLCWWAVAVCLPWFLLTCSVVCGVWREKKESDVHLGVGVEQVPLFDFVGK